MDDNPWVYQLNKNDSKILLWIPYLSEVTPSKKNKCHYVFRFKGGEVSHSLNDVICIMIYGLSGALPVTFLADLERNGIILMVHSRNMKNPYTFFPSRYNSKIDVLTRQLKCKENSIKATYIARNLILKRLHSMEVLSHSVHNHIMRLKAAKSINEIRNIESVATKKYWRCWYESIRVREISRRSSVHPVNQALNAGTFFLQGIILRWVIFHRLSPCHGFLHIPTSYNSLVFDLMEPYRYLFEESVGLAVKDANNKFDNIIPVSINYLKARLEEKVYVPATRQTVREKNLLHGVVLALRSYLLGESPRFVIPVPGDKRGGRPCKIQYKLPGEVK